MSQPIAPTTATHAANGSQSRNDFAPLFDSANTWNARITMSVIVFQDGRTTARTIPSTVSASAGRTSVRPISRRYHMRSMRRMIMLGSFAARS